MTLARPAQFGLALVAVLVTARPSLHAEDVAKHPLSQETRKMMTSAWEKQVAELSKQIKQEPDRVGLSLIHI